MVPKGRDSRCSYRKLLQGGRRSPGSSQILASPLFPFLPQEVFIPFGRPSQTFCPTVSSRQPYDLRATLSAADGARDAGDSCVAGGVEAVNSDAAVSAYDS